MNPGQLVLNDPLLYSVNILLLWYRYARSKIYETSKLFRKRQDRVGQERSPQYHSSPEYCIHRV